MLKWKILSLKELKGRNEKNKLGDEGGNLSFLKKVKKKTEEAAKKGVKAGIKVGEKGVEVGKKAGKKGVKVGKKGVKKTKKWAEE